MTTTATVWLIVGLVSLAAILAVLIGLVLHLFVLGRALGRFQAEVTPITQEISALSERASRRPRPGRRT